jgi:diguanylate cyclase (GGDEF)-like protein/PAS domain S-box-containing protein
VVGLRRGRRCAEGDYVNTNADQLSVPSAGFSRNATGFFTAVDDSMVKVLGWRPDQLVGRASTEFLHPEDQASGIASWFAMLAAPGDNRVWRGRYQGADGSWKWVETVNVNCLDDLQQPVVLTTMTLVTVEQVSLEEEIRARKQLISRLSDALPVGLFQIDTDRRVSFTNDRFHSIVGCPRAATADAQFMTVVPGDRARLDAMLTAVLADQAVDDIDIHLRLPAGGPDVPTAVERVGVLALRPLTDRAGTVTGAIGCLSDITDRVQLQRELETRASIDALTSCLNRAAALDLLEASLVRSGYHGAGTAIMFVDLDRFKEVNDRHGHAAGDQVLQIAARRLAATVRDDDRVGRIGGDEFLVICPNVENPTTALELGYRLAGAVTADIVIGKDTVELRASVGVAWTDQPLAADAFVAQADAAMYQSKQTQESAARLWNPAPIPLTVAARQP